MKEQILQENKKRILIWLGIIVFWVLYYWVVIQSSYTADDRLNATVAGVNYMNDSVWALTGRQFGEWIRAGRFFPFANYTYLLFAYIPSRACYKSIRFQRIWGHIDDGNTTMYAVDRRIRKCFILLSNAGSVDMDMDLSILA